MSMTTDLKRIDIDFRKYAHMMGMSVSKMIRQIALEIWSDVVYNTPVDSGNLRANWNISKRSMNDLYVDYTAMGSVAAPVTEANNIVRVKIKQFTYTDEDKFAPIYITNHTPYAHFVEYGIVNGTPGKMQPPRVWQGKMRGSRMYTDEQGYSLQIREEPKGMVTGAHQRILAKIRTNVKNLGWSEKSVFYEGGTQAPSE